MNKSIKRIMYLLVGIIIIWIGLTVWVEYSGGEKTSFVGDKSSNKLALVVYNPDPIYNLDEQISRKFAEGLSNNGFYVKIATIKSAQKDLKEYDCYMFCANTYNWAPDWMISNYILNHPNLKGKNVVAITIGAGSTQQAKRKLEKRIKSKDVNLLKSETFWLLKPNDESRMDEKNIEVATSMAKDLGQEVGKKLKNLE